MGRDERVREIEKSEASKTNQNQWSGHRKSDVESPPYRGIGQRSKPSGDEVFFSILLTLLPGIGPVTGRKLIEHFGGVREVFKAPKSELQKLGRQGSALAEEIGKLERFKLAEKILINCDKNRIKARVLTDEYYPEALQNIHSAPLVLYQKGDLDLNAQVSVAVVGTRTPTEYGREVAKYFSESLASKGINIVSGLAYGIDYTAHKGALAANGVTSAVLAHGHKYLYPEQHWRAAEAICQNGCLLSDFHYFQKPEAGNFPSRNRLISGLSQAVLVVEAANRGGALITAKFAFEQNREVYAIPGNIKRSKSSGCNELIKANVGRLATDPDDILQDLGVILNREFTETQSTTVREIDLLPEEGDIVSYLSQGELQIEELIQRSEINVGRLQSLLLQMELKGIVKQKPGKLFMLCEDFG